MDRVQRKAAIREWRELQQDPKRLERFRRHAMDMCIEHIDDIAADPDYDSLDDVERVEYLHYIADDLAAALVRYLGFWVFNDYPFVSDWRGRMHTTLGPPSRPAS